MLHFVTTNSILFNRLCVWFLPGSDICSLASGKQKLDSALGETDAPDRFFIKLRRELSSSVLVSFLFPTYPPVLLTQQ